MEINYFILWFKSLINKVQKWISYQVMFNQERSRITKELITNRPKLTGQKFVALIYPSIWGLYYSLSRYIRMGETYDILNLPIFQYITMELVIIAFLGIPNLIVYIRLFVLYTKKIREILWDSTASVAYYYHLQFFLYDTYFYIFYKIYKLHYFLFDVFVVGYGGAAFLDRKKAPKFFQLTSYIYYKPWIITIIMFGLIFIELMLKHGKLYYGIYIMFIYPFVQGILKCYNTIFSLNIFTDKCMSEYIYQSFLYAKPKFRQKFKRYAKNVKTFYNIDPITFSLETSKALMNVLNTDLKEETKVSIKIKKNLNYRIHGIRRSLDFTKNPSTILISSGNSRHYCLRLSGNYYATHGIRWFGFTKKLLSPTNKLHPLAVTFGVSKNPLYALACLNHPGVNYPLLEKLTKKNCYS